jgi:isovaleryl-CoA dehydrogenase
LKSNIDSAAVFLKTSRDAVRAAEESLQIYGGNGYINEYPCGRLLRDAKLYDIGGGTKEIRQWLIGRELFKIHSN